MPIFKTASDAINWAYYQLPNNRHMERIQHVSVLVNFNPDILNSEATRCITDGWALWSA